MKKEIKKIQRQNEREKCQERTKEALRKKNRNQERVAEKFQVYLNYRLKQGIEIKKKNLKRNWEGKCKSRETTPFLNFLSNNFFLRKENKREKNLFIINPVFFLMLRLDRSGFKIRS